MRLQMAICTSVPESLLPCDGLFCSHQRTWAKHAWLQDKFHWKTSLISRSANMLVW